MEQLLVIAIVLLTGVLLLVFRRLLITGRPVGLRPLLAYASLKGQIGRAVESGSRLHISLGQAGFTNPANPTTLAGTAVLDHLAREGYENGIPPLASVGEGTILPVAQESLRHAYIEAGSPKGVKLETAEFIAHETDSIAYMGGVSNLIHKQKLISNIMVGQFGPEIAIVSEAAQYHQVDQVIGSDNPLAMAVAYTATPNILVGEELLAAAAYLDRQPGQMARLLTQDVLRWVVVLLILGIAVYGLIQ